jgi:hypothetical protein
LVVEDQVLRQFRRNERHVTRTKQAKLRTKFHKK